MAALCVRFNAEHGLGAGAWALSTEWVNGFCHA